VILCDLTTCYAIESAWFQRLKVKCDEPFSNFAFNFNLRRYIKTGVSSTDVNDVALSVNVEWKGYAANPFVERSISVANGRAVQVDPIKSTFKAPGTNRLRLKHD